MADSNTLTLVTTYINLVRVEVYDIGFDEVDLHSVATSTEKVGRFTKRSENMITPEIGPGMSNPTREPIGRGTKPTSVNANLNIELDFIGHDPGNAILNFYVQSVTDHLTTASTTDSLGQPIPENG